MSKTPKTDQTEYSYALMGEDAQNALRVCRAFEVAGNALHARLEHWIAMNSGVCSPEDVEAIDNWKAATK